MLIGLEVENGQLEMAPPADARFIQPYFRALSAERADWARGQTLRSQSLCDLSSARAQATVIIAMDIAALAHARLAFIADLTPLHEFSCRSPYCGRVDCKGPWVCTRWRRFTTTPPWSASIPTVTAWMADGLFRSM
jgi:hypothetical protein